MTETFAGTVSITRTGRSTATFELQGDHGNMRLGGDGRDGDVEILDGDGNRRIRFSGGQGLFDISRADGSRVVHIQGEEANLWMGGNGTDGDIYLFPSSATDLNSTSQAAIHLNANAGDIILRNADSAEDFDIEEEADAPPGTVMVITRTGALRPCAKAYDGRVAGVVAGAGPYRPGLVMDRREEAGGRRLPIALSGKVFCHADATAAPIEVGSLLTTAASPGRAMRAVDPARAFGAVIGKALAPLATGTALVPVLVSLQ